MHPLVKKSYSYVYVGPLKKGLTSPQVQTAVCAFHSQKARCYNPKNSRYSTYGAIGVTVEYSIREFIAWYLLELEKFTGEFPQVGRIDHAGPYSFENIRIERRADNAAEVCRRVKSRALVVFDDSTGKELFRAQSMTQAAERLGLSRYAIYGAMRNRRKTLSGYRFSRAEVACP